MFKFFSELDREVSGIHNESRKKCADFAHTKEYVFEKSRGKAEKPLQLRKKCGILGKTGLPERGWSKSFSTKAAQIRQICRKKEANAPWSMAILTTRPGSM